MAKRKSTTTARAKKPAAETTTQDSKPDSAPSTAPATPSPDTPPPANPSTAPAPPKSPPPADPLPAAASAKTDGKVDPLAPPADDPQEDEDKELDGGEEVEADSEERPAMTRKMAVGLALGTASLVYDGVRYFNRADEEDPGGVDPSWIADPMADDVNAVMEFAALELAPFLDRYPEAPAEAAHNHARKVRILPPEAPAWADAPAAVRIAFESFTVHYRHLSKIADAEAERIARLALEDKPPGELPERLKRHKIGYKKNRRLRRSPMMHDKDEVKKRQAAAKRRQRRREKAHA